MNASPGLEVSETNGLPQAQARSQSPEFSLSTSYDNYAYVASPTQQETENESNDVLGSVSSQESVTFDLPIEVGNARKISHTSAWEENTEARGNFDILQSAKQFLSESRDVLNDDSNASLHTDNDTGIHEDYYPEIYSVPVSSPVVLAANPTQGFDGDFVIRHQDEYNKKRVVYENVILPFSSSETCDHQNDDVTELKSPMTDVSKNTGPIPTNTKCSDTNNNEIVNQSTLLPDMPAFVLDGTSDLSSAIISRKYSTSSDSAASTKSSFIESDSSCQKHEYILDADEERSEDDRSFWISQFSFGNDGRQQVSFACNYAKSPEDWTPPNDLSSLSVSEVSNSLRFIGMNEETVEWFSAEKVDGKLLCALDGNELSEHFHLTPFQLKKLTMFLKGWRPKDS